MSTDEKSDNEEDNSRDINASSPNRESVTVFFEKWQEDLKEFLDGLPPNVSQFNSSIKRRETNNIQ